MTVEGKSGGNIAATAREQQGTLQAMQRPPFPFHAGSQIARLSA
jgi:hypothetical protein